MNYDTFVEQVSRRANVPSAQAIALIHATLRTLSERLTGGETLDIAAQLPPPLQLLMRTCPAAEHAQRFSADEFVERVCRCTDVAPATVRTGVRAVFTTLREALTGGEFDDVAAQLPRDYRDLVEPAMAPGALGRRR